MKYIFRVIKFILFCFYWCLLPVLAFLVNVVAVIWHFGKPVNGWFKLEEDDWYWHCDSEVQRMINRMQGMGNKGYKNPWDILINKKSTY